MKNTNELQNQPLSLAAVSSRLLPQPEIEKYFVRCDFDDECDKCKNPENGSYASGYTNDECGCEVDYYICGRCASEAIPGIIEREAKEKEYFDSLPDDLY